MIHKIRFEAGSTPAFVEAGAAAALVVDSVSWQYTGADPLIRNMSAKYLLAKPGDPAFRRASFVLLLSSKIISIDETETPHFRS
jgi:hypothetical protein